MKVFIDCEFYEFQPHEHLAYEEGPLLLGANAVQLISIGAVREDGAEFYAENADFNWNNVPSDHWIQDNVRPHLWNNSSDPAWMIQHEHWRSKTAPKGGFYKASHLAEALHAFVGQEPEFWGYFCDYDWVAICGLYGRMVDLPRDWPMYCLDLKQLMHHLSVKREHLPTQGGTLHHALADAQWNRDVFAELERESRFYRHSFDDDEVIVL